MIEVNNPTSNAQPQSVVSRSWTSPNHSWTLYFSAAEHPSCSFQIQPVLSLPMPYTAETVSQPDKVFAISRCQWTIGRIQFTCFDSLALTASDTFRFPAYLRFHCFLIYCFSWPNSHSFPIHVICWQCHIMRQMPTINYIVWIFEYLSWYRDYWSF